MWPSTNLERFNWNWDISFGETTIIEALATDPGAGLGLVVPKKMAEDIHYSLQTWRKREENHSSLTFRHSTRTFHQTCGLKDRKCPIKGNHDPKKKTYALFLLGLRSAVVWVLGS